MPRRITGGSAGSPGVGAIQVQPTAVLTTATDQDITMTPQGTARFVVDNNMQINSTFDLRFGDSDNSNYVGFQAPSTVTSNAVWTLPAADGSANTFLRTDGAGTLSWSASTVGLTDQTTSATTHYPLLSSSTSGSVSGVNVSTTKLSYVPSTGTLTATAISAGTLTETSSITLKENIHPLTDALDLITKLQSYIYDRKDGSMKNEPGLIAEEVNGIIPNLVTKDENGNPTGILYSKLTAYLVECVKSLKSEIDILKAGAK